MAVRAKNALEEGRAARSPDAGARHRRLGGWVEKEEAGDEDRDMVGQLRHHRDRAALMEEGSRGAPGLLVLSWPFGLLLGGEGLWSEAGGVSRTSGRNAAWAWPVAVAV